MLAPGGVLVYATCSLEPEEGEDQIARFLEKAADARLAPCLPQDVGGAAELISAGGFLRALPSHFADIGGCDGFFAARLVKLAA
jgi:16S rRNA (cytosine967-C5)-methyltransferase